MGVFVSVFVFEQDEFWRLVFSVFWGFLVCLCEVFFRLVVFLGFFWGGGVRWGDVSVGLFFL